MNLPQASLQPLLSLKLWPSLSPHGRPRPQRRRLPRRHARRPRRFPLQPRHEPRVRRRPLIRVSFPRRQHLRRNPDIPRRVEFCLSNRPHIPRSLPGPGLPVEFPVLPRGPWRRSRAHPQPRFPDAHRCAQQRQPRPPLGWLRRCRNLPCRPCRRVLRSVGCLPRRSEPRCRGLRRSRRFPGPRVQAEEPPVAGSPAQERKPSKRIGAR